MSGDEQSAGKCSGVGQGGGKFGEPLHVERGAKGPYLVGIVPRGRPNGEGLAELWRSGVGLDKLGISSDALAQRIIACVNACAGMEDPEKEIAALRGWCRDCVWSNAASDPATEPCAGIDHCENAGADKYADYPRAVECSGYRSRASEMARRRIQERREAESSATLARRADECVAACAGMLWPIIDVGALRSVLRAAREYLRQAEIGRHGDPVETASALVEAAKACEHIA